MVVWLYELGQLSLMLPPSHRRMKWPWIFLAIFYSKRFYQNIHPWDNSVVDPVLRPQQRARRGRIIWTDEDSAGAAQPEDGSFPWLASLFLRQSTGEAYFMCAATILTSRVLVSAAHCFNDRLIFVWLTQHHLDHLQISWHGLVCAGGGQLHGFPGPKRADFPGLILLKALTSNKIVIFKLQFKPIKLKFCISRSRSSANQLSSIMNSNL